MSEHECGGCREYGRLSRRRFLGFAGVGLAAAAVPAWLPRVVLADSENSARDTLVSIFLRGGSDGLSLCVPHGDDDYYALRPTLAIREPGAGGGRALDLDGFFGLPPAFEPLLDIYRGGDLAIVHACGLDNPTRSHFDAMHFMEVGIGDPPADRLQGWLGRHLAATAPTVADGLLRAVGIGFGLPRSLVGAPAAVPFTAPEAYDLAGNEETRGLRGEVLHSLYAATEGPMNPSAANTFRTIELLRQIDFAGYLPAAGAQYPEGEFGHALRSTAALIKAEVGVEAVAIDLGGWDTHEQQGPLDGQLASLMSELARGLAAFHTDLAGGGSQVSVVAMSEFGRNAFENGSLGTDHGHGGLMLAMGPGISGGQVVADWPGLAAGQLYDGQDLQVTIDYREVLTELLAKRLGNPDFQGVFDDPALDPRDHGVFLAR